MGCVSSRTQISHGPLSFRAYFRDLLYNCCASSLHYHDTLPFFLLSYCHSLDSVWFFFFFQVIESREMMDESKDRDAIDGAVRVAHLVKHVYFPISICTVN